MSTIPTDAARIHALHHMARRFRAGLLPDADLRAVVPAIAAPGMAPAVLRSHLKWLGLALADDNRPEIARRTAALMCGESHADVSIGTTGGEIVVTRVGAGA